MMKQHALLSPSKAYRWAVCTPSARLEENIIDEPSPAATEGTLAHELCEKILKGEAYDPERYTPEMIECADAYVYHITVDLQLVDYHIEAKVQIPDIRDCFGTVDCWGVHNGTLYVTDYKYGKGVEVSANENYQLALYAYGLLKSEVTKGITSVVMEIFQPRKLTLSRWEISPIALQKWVKEHIVDKSEWAFKGKGYLLQGDHCDFCKARPTCRAQFSSFYNVTDLHKHQIDEVDLLYILKWGNDVKTFIDKVQEQALKDMLDGKKIPGYKVVEGRSNRTIPDYNRAVEALGGDPESYYAKKPLGITDLQKMVGVKKMKELEEAGIIVKPEGKPTLVPEDDKREDIFPFQAIDIL